MHGVVLWKRNAWTYDPANEKFVFNKKCMSTLITWQDQRCSEEFLRALPKRSSTSVVDPCAGFGCATLFWLLRKGDLLQDFECVGTIQDLMVAMLTGLNKPVMTPQNAASFGYFDVETNQWDLQALELSDFPCDILPEIVDESQVAGELRHFWLGIPARTVIFPATGDAQCSVLSGLQAREGSAILYMGTSAQISFVVDYRGRNHKGHHTYFPYFNGKHLCVAASLNGGNVLTQFVDMVKLWLYDLGVSLPESKVWDRLLNPTALTEQQIFTGVNARTESIRVRPLLFGERHNPQSSGSVTGIRAQMPTLDKTFRAICAGLIDNLVEMLPLSVLQDHGISRLVCAGKVINHNRVISSEVQRVFQDFSVEFASDCDSALGAALGAAMFRR
ncbi:sedoheptulokinase-like isoform X2 [Varroa jacobsoni]|nr:sedoheptulokinase-like isoform X2 [Varroa jacobsoni]